MHLTALILSDNGLASAKSRGSHGGCVESPQLVHVLPILLFVLGTLLGITI